MNCNILSFLNNDKYNTPAKAKASAIYLPVSSGL